MRRLTLAIVLAFIVIISLALASMARAQPVGSPPSVCTAASVTPWDMAINAKGLWAARWIVCKEGGEPLPQLYAVTRGAVEQVLNADGAVAAAIEFGKLFLGTPITEASLVEVYGPDKARIDLARPLPPSVWSVAKYASGAATSRFSYPVINGARSPSTNSANRATIGATCDCTNPIVEGANTFCPFTGGGSLVALCSKASQ